MNHMNQLIAAAISWFMWFMSPSSPSTHVRRQRRW